MTVKSPPVIDVPPTQRWLMIIAVMSATLMQVIDTTIINVALPHMQGALSANPDEISWTLTSYLIASAIFMPLTGFFSDRLGRKKYLLICMIGFTLTSALCGASVSLVEIIIFRLLQGVFGAALVPLSQAILADIFSSEERGKAMAIWGMGVMVGPILGPTLGGYLTEVASWRWTFYVNVPIGILTTLLALQVVPESEKKKRTLDWGGLIFISCAIGGLQYLLDRGQHQDWFAAIDIRIAATVSALGFISFAIYSLMPRCHPIFDLKIFRDRNFTIASLLLGGLGLGMYGMILIQPLMLENLLNYPVLTTGLVMAPRGISGILGMMIMGKLLNRYDTRWLVLIGCLITASGIYICTHYSFNISPIWVVIPILIQGFGGSILFSSLSTLSFATLPAHLRVEAAGLFSLLRTMGGSIGISIAVTFYTRGAQQFWNQLGGFINPYNPAVNEYLQSFHIHYQDPLGITLLGIELFKQSQMLSFVNVFAFITYSFLAMIPLVFLLKKPPQKNIHVSAAID